MISVVDIILSDKFSQKEKEVLHKMMEETLVYFPQFEELGAIQVNKIEAEHPLGLAYFTPIPKIALRFKPTYHTIAHELIHVLRGKKLIDIPASEIATDVFASARAELFNDSPCYYVDHSQEIYAYDKDLFRHLMVRGAKYYKKHGKYKWCRIMKSDLTIAKAGVTSNHSQHKILGYSLSSEHIQEQIQPEVDSSQPLDVKQEGGDTPTIRNLYK